MRLASTPDHAAFLVCAVTNLILAQTSFLKHLETICLLSSVPYFPHPPPPTGCKACPWTSAEPRPTTTSCWSEINQEFPVHSGQYAHPSYLGDYQNDGYANSYPAAYQYNDHLSRETAVTNQHNRYAAYCCSPAPPHEPSATPPLSDNHSATNPRPAPTAYSSTPALQDNEPLEPILPLPVRVRRPLLVPAPVQGCVPPPGAVIDQGITVVPRAARTSPPSSVNSNIAPTALEDSFTESSTSHLNSTSHRFTSAFSSNNIFQPLARRPRAARVKPLNSTTPVCHHEPPPSSFRSVLRQTQRKPRHVLRANPSSVPATRHPIYRTSHKHPRNYKAKKGTAFCRSAPATKARVVQHRAVRPPEYPWHRAASSSPFATKSATGTSSSFSSNDYASAPNGKLWGTDTSSEESTSCASGSSQLSPQEHTKILLASTVLQDLDWLHTDESNSHRLARSTLHEDSYKPFHVSSVCYNTSEAIVSSPSSASEFSTRATCLGSSTVIASLYLCSSARNADEQRAAISNGTATCLNVSEEHAYEYFTTHAPALSNANVNRSEEILKCEQCSSLRKRSEVSVVHWEGRRIARCRTCPTAAPRSPTRGAEFFVCSKHQRRHKWRNVDRELQAQGILQCSASNACQ